MTRRGASGLTALVVLTTLLSGCLDEERNRCKRTEPATGGDPRGLWELIDVCFNPESVERVAGMNACPAERSVLEGLTAVGTVEYKADGTYDSRIGLYVTLRSELPLSCVPQATNCQGIAQLLTGTQNTATEDLSRVAFCKGTDICKCAVKNVSQQHEVSTYTIQGAELKEAPNEEAWKFSVVGKELRLHNSTFSGRLIRK